MEPDAPTVRHALLLGSGPSPAAAKRKRQEAEAEEDVDHIVDAAAPVAVAEESTASATTATATKEQARGEEEEREPPTAPSSGAAAQHYEEPSSLGPRVELDVFLPGGTQGLRAPMLARNWVRRLGHKVMGKPGTFMAVLLDKGRIPASIVMNLEKTIGYNPKEHDPVVFFDRRGRRLVGSFGAVLGGTGQLWGPQAYAEMSARDASAAWAFQCFLETDAFNWLECERCRKWRMYPHDDVLLPGEEEGGVFVCDMARTWNPAVAGCETEQEISFDSMEQTQQQEHGEDGQEAGT